jgi:VacB/RNase II family 3'-5' exoribonuclease
MTAIVRHERLDSMRLIEEFMLAANEAVAEALHKAGAGALYRVHEQPDPERIEEFSQLVASLGYRMPENQATVRPEHFQLILRQIEGKPEEKLVSYLLLRTMKLARYHEENLGHFGLATDMYAHFTSPIRRYPDLVVHRALRALRQGTTRSARPWLREKLPGDGSAPLGDGAPRVEASASSSSGRRSASWRASSATVFSATSPACSRSGCSWSSRRSTSRAWCTSPR